MEEELWKPATADLDFRPHDLLLLRYGRGLGKLLGPQGELLQLSEHRRAVGFQTKSEALRFIREKANRYRGSLFFATRNELLQSLLES